MECEESCPHIKAWDTISEKIRIEAEANVETK